MNIKNSILGLSLTVFFRILVIKLFSILLDFTVMISFGGRVGYIVTQICCLALLISVTYSTMWNMGFGDVNRAKLDLLKRDALRGLKAGVIGSSFEIIGALLLILTKFNIVPRFWISLFGIFNAPFLPFHLTMLPATLTVAELPLYNFIFSASTVLVIPLISAFAYALGNFELSLPEIFIYTTPESREEYKIKRNSKRNKTFSKIFK